MRICFSTTSHDPSGQSAIDFWTIARSLRAEVAPYRTPQGMTLFFQALEHIVSGGPGLQGIKQFVLNDLAAEMMVSNLDVLPIDTRFGRFRLSAVWGPSRLVGFDGEQLIGVAAVHGVIHLVHSSYAPIPNMPARTKSALLEALRSGR